MVDVKSVIQDAIMEEEYFYKLYTHLADMNDDPEIKKGLKILAKQELEHKRKLESLSSEDLDIGPLGEHMVFENVLSTPLVEFNTPKDMFRFAVKQEIHARVVYEELAEVSNESKLKDTFFFLASQEKEHEMFIRKAMMKLYSE